jgi:hypothetical protein
VCLSAAAQDAGKSICCDFVEHHMKSLVSGLIMASVLSFFPMRPVWAQDFARGVAAFEAGDYAAALREWRPLAEQGNVFAQTNLGYMYDTGSGVAKDYAKAVKWYRLAAEKGNTSAQNNLGSMYDNGKGVAQDHVQAFTWYRLAAEQPWIYVRKRSWCPTELCESLKVVQDRIATRQRTGPEQFGHHVS